MRGATLASDTNNQDGLFQSTLLMRGATRGWQGVFPLKTISIHAPHARSDRAFLVVRLLQVFQSTLLMRGATERTASRPSRHAYFNPRSSCEERHQISQVYQQYGDFNPRSSCEERHA